MPGLCCMMIDWKAASGDARMQVGLLGRLLPWVGASSGPTPSSEPALGLHVAAPAASQHLNLLVLTTGSLDKWQVGSPLRTASALDAQLPYQSVTTINRQSLVTQGVVGVVSTTLAPASQVAVDRRPLQCPPQSLGGKES